MDNFFAVATFADDVRMEESGKVITIGEYDRDMIVRRFPVMLDRFFVNLKIGAPLGYHFDSFDLLLELPGGKIEKRTLRGSEPLGTPAFMESKTEAPDKVLLSAQLLFTDLEIPEDGFIRCRVQLPERKEPIKAGVLLVASADKMGAGTSISNRDVSSMIGSISQFYAHAEFLQEEERRSLALCIFERLKPIGEKFSSILDEKRPVYSWLSYEECVIWFPKPLLEAPEVKVEVSGTDKYEILDVNRFGFRLLFDIEEGQTVNFNVLEPSFSD